MFKNSSFQLSRFGMEPFFPLTMDQIAFIQEHYKEYSKKEKFQIDNQTWQDVEMDRMLIDMDACYSSAGDMLLYGMLRTPCLNNQDLQFRKDIMKWAKEQEEEREYIISLLYEIGKREEDMGRMMAHSYANPRRRKLSIGLAALFILSLPLALLFPNPMLLFMFAILLCNLLRASIIHKTLQNDVNALVHILAHIEVLHKVAAHPLSNAKALNEEVQKLSEQLQDVHVGHSLNYFEESLHVLNFLFQTESITFDKYAQTIYEKRTAVRESIALIGTIDACIAAASYIENRHLNFDIQLCEQSSLSIEAIAMVHPLLKEAVPNDVDIHENRMLTGSNATGKSTYLKMVALNAVLAQSFHFVCAKSYQASFFQIITSMSVQDDLLRQESTFVAEVNSLKGILQREQTVPTLTMIDEILRGTNTQERIAASSVILKMIAKRNFLCLCATHDIELTRILSKYYQDYHFTETMRDGKMSFDYKIHKGISPSRNAIKLLELLGYDATLTKHAEERLERFEKNGVWDVIE